MALIKCKECGKDVSTKAEKCPGCGAPVESQGVISKLVGNALSVLALAFFVMLFFGGTEKKSATEEAKPKPEAPKISDAECMKDIQCWYERIKSDALWPCTQEIERTPSFSFRWTDKFLDPKFSKVRWVDQSTGKIALIGDKIEVQNQFGAYQGFIYECEFDPSTKSVLSANLIPGRL